MSIGMVWLSVCCPTGVSNSGKASHRLALYITHKICYFTLCFESFYLPVGIDDGKTGTVIAPVLKTL